jgi:hypothetical protein
VDVPTGVDVTTGPTSDRAERLVQRAPGCSPLGTCVRGRARGHFWQANAPRCGSTDELEFDHIDPETKVFAVGSDMSRAWDKLVEEALKCQLPCRECHVAKGIEDRPEPAHSYYRYWYYGCRCATCKAANARKSARQRERKLGERWG